MSRSLLTIRLSQDTNDKVHGDKAYDRQFWIDTKTDLAYALDKFEEEAHELFTFEKTGVTESFAVTWSLDCEKEENNG